MNKIKQVQITASTYVDILKEKLQCNYKASIGDLQNCFYRGDDDSSGFVMNNYHLQKVTDDHTLVNLLVSAGELTEEEARNHPRKNILMNALGINDPIDIDIFDCSMEIDSILLCSDGLTTMLLDEQIEKTLLEENLTIEEKVERLINKANNRGGKDNISVAYLVK